MSFVLMVIYFHVNAVVRTLTGHRGSCDSVEFHPFGEFFASGSSDNDLKIWDIRRKGCIHTYKGHSGAIKTVKFTPDGRWVVSGGEDNIVKVMIILEINDLVSIGLTNFPVLSSCGI